MRGRTSPAQGGSSGAFPDDGVGQGADAFDADADGVPVRLVCG